MIYPTVFSIYCLNRLYIKIKYYYLKTKCILFWVKNVILWWLKSLFLRRDSRQYKIKEGVKRRAVRWKSGERSEQNDGRLGSIEKRPHSTWQTKVGSTVGLSVCLCWSSLARLPCGPRGQPQFMRLERKSLIDLSWLDGRATGNNDTHQNNTAESWSSATWLCNDNEHSFTFPKQTNRTQKLM